MSSDDRSAESPPGRAGGVEYLDQHGASQAPRRRRWSAVAVGGVALVAAAGVGAWGLSQYLGGGGDPAEAVPASAFAYLALDLDPGAGQQLEAYQTLKKFPSLAEELSLTDQQDLRRALWETLVEESGCRGLDYDDDLAPWLGDSLAIAVMPGPDEPVPFGVVEVTDEQRATEGVDTLTACGAGQQAPGTAFVGDYLVLAEDDARADAVVEAVAEGTLADSEDYQSRVADVGGVGFVTGYASAAAADEVQNQLAGGLRDGALTAGIPAQDLLDEAVGSFEGAALSLRFEDESLELGVASSGASSPLAGAGESGVGDLPGTTTAALGFPVPDGFADAWLDQLRSVLGDKAVDAMLREAEDATVLDLPEDVTALLGEGLSVAVDSSLDPAAVQSGGAEALDGLPAGLRIVGGEDSIAAAAEKLLVAVQAPADAVSVVTGAGVVGISFDPAYAARLAEEGDLGDQERFQDAVPGADGGPVVYVDFDAAWLQEAVRLDGGPDVADTLAHLEPLESLGISLSQDDATSTMALRLSTD